jgi:hypothetical protein
VSETVSGFFEVALFVVDLCQDALCVGLMMNGNFKKRSSECVLKVIWWTLIQISESYGVDVVALLGVVRDVDGFFGEELCSFEVPQVLQSYGGGWGGGGGGESVLEC